jgi:flavin reductase (DIM6/NTAB) family NADH-FMN oxidoreductase RutF
MNQLTSDQAEEAALQSDAPQHTHASWTKLTHGKELSRLLYPNPVCFLCTGSGDTRNVMVLSWLTATNNEGKLLFSIHKHRHSTTLLLHQKHFLLSVPVHGMETLIRQVGSVSGASGSKFPDIVSKNHEPDFVPHTRKQKKPRFPQGIPGLRAISMSDIDASYDTSDRLFGVEGCVAFIACQIYQILQNSPIIDEDHWLVVAEMKAAWVHPDYWCSARNRFLPASDEVPSYLTFLGSQTFGQVVVTRDQDE